MFFFIIDNVIIRNNKTVFTVTIVSMTIAMAIAVLVLLISNINDGSQGESGEQCRLQ